MGTAPLALLYTFEATAHLIANYLCARRRRDLLIRECRAERESENNDVAKIKGGPARTIYILYIRRAMGFQRFIASENALVTQTLCGCVIAAYTRLYRICGLGIHCWARRRSALFDALVSLSIRYSHFQQ